jgi:hypothetical protein
MKATTCLNTHEWLKTSDPVLPVGSSVASELVTALREVLSEGVYGIPDMSRPGFYDIETADRWYYIHIRKHLSRVYLVATRQALRVAHAHQVQQVLSRSSIFPAA